ncbi:DUF6177 family protein [Actinomadura nitritigenes]|uniref:DUF6177 family protein n=1 Tax=Actinomadura nitritigenes TaxID=134602 RepID=UPI003D8ECA51
MTYELVVLTQREPDALDLVDAMVSADGTLWVGDTGDSTLVQLCDEWGRVLVSLGTVQRVEVEGEVERLLGDAVTAGLTVPYWQVEARVPDDAPEGPAVAHRFAAALTSRLGGAVWPPSPPEPRGAGANAPPAVDLIREKSVVIMQEQEVVPMSSWIIDMMARCADEDLPLAVLTPPGSRITLPLRLALRGTQTRWVVQDADDGYYDGLSGLPLDWNGNGFVLAERARTGGPSLAFLHGLEDADLGHHVVVDLRVVHDATDELVLGSAIEELALALAGAAPAGWGAAEPAVARWDRAALTALCRHRAPRPTWLVFTGGHGEPGPLFGGAVRVSRVDTGVKEEITLVVSLPEDAWSPDALDALESLADHHAGTVELSTLTAHWTPGRRDLTYPAHLLGFPRPLALALGPVGVAEAGRERVLSAPAKGRLIGDPTEPGAWYTFDDDTSDAPWRGLSDLMRHLT